MKNILFALFAFIFTAGLTIYNFYRGAYVFGWLTIIFAIIDLIILIISIIRRINSHV